VVKAVLQLFSLKLAFAFLILTLATSLERTLKLWYFANSENKAILSK